VYSKLENAAASCIGGRVLVQVLLHSLSGSGTTRVIPEDVKAEWNRSKVMLMKQRRSTNKILGLNPKSAALWVQIPSHLLTQKCDAVFTFVITAKAIAIAT